VAVSAPPTRNWVVITTVNAPGAAVESLLATLADAWNVVVVGDTRTPPLWNEWPVEFLSLEKQRELYGAFAAAAPTNHYCRKNFGYLYALQRGAACILEADDDGSPYEWFGANVGRAVRGRLVGGGDWVNVYRWFTDRLIWPRGLPLDAIHQRGDLFAEEAGRESPVQQFLVDNDPDVDAIFRHIFPATGFTFDRGAAPVLLAPGTWCPFNTQNTLWFEEAFPLLYLPSFCNFRVTDVWRSLVAQRALWLSGSSLAFHPATIAQTRNLHDLAQDFVDEIPSYTQNRKIAERLDRAAGELGGQSTGEAGRRLWLALIDAGFLPEREAALIDHWFDAVQRCSARTAITPPVAAGGR
jgi:hypothetical protein